jgi:multisubunit Na+/H+ antiporter MnhC subunit
MPNTDYLFENWMVALPIALIVTAIVIVLANWTRKEK